KAEDLLAYEAGYRAQLSESATIDVAAFYNDYNDITSAEPGVPFIGTLRDQDTPAFIIPLSFQNELKVESYGVEVAAEFRLFDWWRLIAGYSYIDLNAKLGNSLDESEAKNIESSTPNNTASLRSAFDFTEDITFDAILRYVDHISEEFADKYMEMDARLAWQATESVELAIVGRNLLHDEHKEFESQVLRPVSTEIDRSVFGTVTVTF
ncbi:MAG: TonB-dependent receptor, partial [Bdellovibrionales bacterium]|nr:TonB-dependent receptor [Bdellovibrionales bacterium]